MRIIASVSALWWVALALFAVGAVALWLPRRAWICGAVLLGAGVAVDVVFTVRRALDIGQPPVLGTFENTLVAAPIIGSIAIGYALVGPFAGKPQLTRVLAPWAPLTLAYGLLFRSEPLALEAAGRSLLAYAHAFVGWTDLGFLLAATMAAAGAAWVGEKESPWDEAHVRALGIGFALLTVTMATGAVLSMLLFSEWFRWQIVEALTAALWIAYGLILHARLMFGWRGRKLAGATLAALPLALAAFWIWSVYPDTYHYFEKALSLR